MTLAAWLLTVMEILAPSERVARVVTYPEAVETAEARHARYVEIADTLEPQGPPHPWSETDDATREP